MTPKFRPQLIPDVARAAGARGLRFGAPAIAFEGYWPKPAVLVVWCTDWVCQQNAGQLKQKEYLFLRAAHPIECTHFKDVAIGIN